MRVCRVKRVSVPSCPSKSKKGRCRRLLALARLCGAFEQDLAYEIDQTHDVD